MKFSPAKMAAAALIATTCLGMGSVRAQAAEGIFSTTAVAGFSLSVNDIVNSEEEITPAADTNTETDPLAAGATDAKTIDAESIKIPEEETKDKDKTEAVEEKETSKYDDIAVAKVTNYLNVRKKPTEDAEVLGKLYKGAAGEIVKQDKGWTKIKSGSVTGWVKDEYLVTGEKVPAYADKVCEKKVTVTTETLKVREKATLKAKVVTLVPEGEVYQVLKEKKEWVAIKVDEDVRGFVSKEYVDIDYDFDDAVSIEEEKKADEEAARLQAEQEAQQNQNNQSNDSSNSGSSSSSNSNSGSSSSSSNSNSGSSSSSSNSNSGSSNSSNSGSSSSSSSSESSGKTYQSGGSLTRQNLVNYAMQFVGNPYVYGGTSLTNGTDCSGFTMSVYKHFGVSINRSSREQVNNGRAVSLSDVQPGDLIFYKNGSTIGHVALYIGNGQVVHASSRKTGIKVSNMNYRTPYCARSILN